VKFSSLIFLFDSSFVRLFWSEKIKQNLRVTSLASELCLSYSLQWTLKQLCFHVSSESVEIRRN